jgi:hypothetical protein
MDADIRAKRVGNTFELDVPANSAPQPRRRHPHRAEARGPN